MTQAPTSPPAVVIGLDTIVGLQTARVLAAHDVPVIGIADDPTSYCARPRAAGRVIAAPTAGDGLVEALLGLVTALDEAPVLFPCRDPSVLTVSAHRDQLSPAGVLLPEHTVLESLSDKSTFAAHATAAGLRVPATWAVHDEVTLAEAAGSVPYPAILKPSFRDDRWQDSGRAKGFVVEAAAALERAYRSACASADRFVVQEWIAGPRTGQYTCNALFGRDGAVRGTFVSRKVRQWPLDTGVGSMGVGIVDREIEDLTVRLFTSVGFVGLAYLELKRDPRGGAPVAIEPNVGRPTGRSALADHSGVDLLYGMYREVIGHPLPDIGEQPATTATWVHLRADIQAGLAEVRQGDTSVRRWLRSYRRPLVEAVWSRSDPEPMIRDVLRSAGVAGRAIARRVSGRGPAGIPGRRS